MTDPFAEGPVHEQGDGAPFVIRLSRNASGARTYTIGATLQRDEVPEAVVEALFDLERLVAAGMAAGIEKPERVEKGVPLTAQLRRSLIVEAMRKVGADASDAVGSGWATTGEIVNHVNGHRSQVHGDLKALVADGVVEYKRGKGGIYPSTYRLAKVPEAQKGTAKA